MDNFDLRKFLAENKLTPPSNTKKVLKEDYRGPFGLSEALDNLLEAYNNWYQDSLDNWDDFKDVMDAESVDQAAKEVQMEILVYLSNKMNERIEEPENRVSMNLK